MDSPTRAHVSVRPERLGDESAVYQVHLRAFGRPGEAELVRRLRETCPSAVSLVAEMEGRIVGHILFTPVTIEGSAQCISGAGLAPLAVLPECQRRGIGTRLVDEGLREMSRREPFVVVLGDPAYYGRFGFQAASRHGVACEFAGVPDDAFMIIVWDDRFLRGVTGVAKYRPEFGCPLLGTG